MKENIKMIKNIDMAFFIGMTAKFIKGIGKKGKKTVKEKFIILKKKNGKKKNGKMDSKLNKVINLRIIMKSIRYIYNNI